jgi:predicted enzyme related to lactoylglutathione lyase
MSNPKLLPGKFVWFELVSGDPKKAQAFYGAVLGWKTVPFPMGDSAYEMIYAGDTMIGGYAAPAVAGQRSHWISYVSVDDVDVAAKAASASGGKVLEPPFDIPNVGRAARIADAQGAELYLFRKVNDDPVDGVPPPGGWLWNELHTTDPAQALRFYEKVVGFSNRAMDMGPAGTYHILSRGDVDRGGVTSHLNAGVRPHWLPYVAVDDVDATIATARKLGATIPMPPEDIPGVGRLGILEDPTGAVLAMLKPVPAEKTVEVRS